MTSASRLRGQTTLVEAAKVAIRRVFENTAVPASVTKESLEELRDELDMLIDAVPAGKERRG